MHFRTDKVRHAVMMGIQYRKELK